MIAAATRERSLAVVDHSFRELRREREARSDYDFTRRSNYVRQRRGLHAYGAAADKHIRGETEYYLGCEIANDIDRNDMVVGQGIDRLCANILQHGFTYDPQTGDEEVDGHLKSRWAGWAGTTACDLQDQFNFDALSYFALRGSIVTGDMFALPLFFGKLQLIEGYRCRSPFTFREDIVLGVELDNSRRRQNFYFAQDDIAQISAIYRGETSAVPAYGEDGQKQVFQIWHPKRSTQTRGVTKLAPVGQTTTQLGDLHFAKLLQQQMASAIAMVRERDPGFDPDGVYTDEFVRMGRDPYGSYGDTVPLKGWAPGMMYTSFPGERVKFHAPNLPGQGFIEHSTQLLQFIALNLDLPLIMFLMDASATNFSGWRGVMNQAQIKFKQFQRWLKSQWHTPVANWKVRQWTDPTSPLRDRDLIRLIRDRGVDPFKHDFTLPTWPYIEPLKDVQADLLEHRNSLNSMSQIQERRGRDWDVVHQEIVNDNAKIIVAAKRKAIAINDEFPEDKDQVRWRELVGLPLAEGIQMNLTAQPEAETPTGANDDESDDTDS